MKIKKLLLLLLVMFLISLSLIYSKNFIDEPLYSVVMGTGTKLIIGGVPPGGPPPEVHAEEEYECNDGVDNDGDGLIDFPDDPGCLNEEDDDEIDGVPTVLFDIRVKVINDTKEVKPGEDVIADVTIVNLGDLKPVDVFLKCNIEDLDKKVLTYYAEYLAVDDEVDIWRELTVPRDATGGQYNFACYLTYEDKQIHASDMFNVIELEFPKILERYNYGVLILFLLVLLLIYRWYVLMLKKKKRKRR